MSLINCPECHKQVSDKAPVCPTCGNPIAASVPVGSSRHVGADQTVELTSKRLKLVSLFSIIVCIFGFLMFIGGSQNTLPDGSRGGDIGMVLFCVGLAAYLINRFRIWWHHK